MTGEEMGTYHLADRPEIYEPARSNSFEFIATGLGELLPAGMIEELANEDDWITDAQDVLRLSLISAGVPHFTIQPIEVRRGNSVMKFAGLPSFSQEPLQFNDYVDARTKDILLAWQAQAYNVRQDVVNLAKKYKHDCILVEYNPDFSKIVRKWTLKGCWVSGVSEGELSKENGDKRQVSATIEFDRAIPEIVK